jgi:hypothetical protein
MGEDMTGQRPSGEGDEILEEEALLRGKDCIFCGVFSSLVWRVWVDYYRGAPGCWEFWAQGPGILTKSWS